MARDGTTCRAFSRTCEGGRVLGAGCDEGRWVSMQTCILLHIFEEVYTSIRYTISNIISYKLMRIERFLRFASSVISDPGNEKQAHLRKRRRE